MDDDVEGEVEGEVEDEVDVEVDVEVGEVRISFHLTSTATNTAASQTETHTCASANWRDTVLPLCSHSSILSKGQKHFTPPRGFVQAGGFVSPFKTF